MRFFKSQEKSITGSVEYTIVNRLIIYVLLTMGLFLSCSNNTQEKKALFDSIKNNSDYILTLNREDQNQTVDSIIIFQSGVVTSTGQPIFKITTKSEKRKTDSTNEARKKTIPNPFAPATNSLNYSLSEKSLFTIILYDTLGNEIEKLVNQVLAPGDYEVSFSIYYIMEPNVYLLETKSKGYNDFRKLIIK